METLGGNGGSKAAPKGRGRQAKTVPVVVHLSRKHLRDLGQLQTEMMLAAGRDISRDLVIAEAISVAAKQGNISVSAEEMGA